VALLDQDPGEGHDRDLRPFLVRPRPRREGRRARGKGRVSNPTTRSAHSSGSLSTTAPVLIKFFLHIDKKEQKRRFLKLEDNPATRWKVTKTDWMHHDHYRKWLYAVEEMLLKTDSGFAPWTIVERTDRRFAT